jgi:hypothetical protein
MRKNGPKALPGSPRGQCTRPAGDSGWRPPIHSPMGLRPPVGSGWRQSKEKNIKFKYLKN